MKRKCLVRIIMCGVDFFITTNRGVMVFKIVAKTKSRKIKIMQMKIGIQTFCRSKQNNVTRNLCSIHILWSCLLNIMCSWIFNQRGWKIHLSFIQIESKCTRGSNSYSVLKLEIVKFDIWLSLIKTL